MRLFITMLLIELVLATALFLTYGMLTVLIFLAICTFLPVFLRVIWEYSL